MTTTTKRFRRKIHVTWDEFRRLKLLAWECEQETPHDDVGWVEGNRKILGSALVDELTWGDPIDIIACSSEEIAMPDRSRRPVHKMMDHRHNAGVVARTYCGVDPYRKGVLTAFNENPEFGPEVTCQRCLKAEQVLKDAGGGDANPR